MASELPFAIPAHWTRSTLGGVCAAGGGDVQTGPFGSQLHASDYVSDGIPVVMPQDLVNGRISEVSIARVSEVDRDRLSKHALQRGDIVYSRRGDIRRRALVTDSQTGWLCGTGCLRVRPGRALVPAYLYYVLGHPMIQGWIERHAIGATMPNLNTSILAACPIGSPPQAEQRAIASVLGTVDAKVDSDTRLIRHDSDLLEESFRRIAGGVSTRVPLSEVALEEKRRIQPSDALDSLFEQFSIPAFDLGNGPQVCAGSTMASAKTVLPVQRPLVLLSKLNPRTKRVWWPETLGIGTPVCSPEFVAVTPRHEPDAAWLYACLAFDRVYYEQVLAATTGTTGSRQRVKPSDVFAATVPCVSGAERERWDALAWSVLRRRVAAVREMRTLTAIRDALLPKLVSGQIRVPLSNDPEEQVGAAIEALA